jgi:beta-glucosidase
LRETWNFTKDYNFVVGDCGAVKNIHATHKYNATPEAGATAALRAGVDWDCYGTKSGGGESAYTSAVEMGLLQLKTLDRALTRVLTAHVHLGFFDSPELVSYKRLPPETIDAPAHRALASWAASRVIVLLQNQKRALPLDTTKLKAGGKPVVLVGPNADNFNALWGDYAGPSAGAAVTAKDAAVDEFGAAMVKYESGCNTTKCTTDAGFGAAVDAVAGSSAVIAVMGTQGNGKGADENEAHDRLNITLPGLQEVLLAKLRAAATSEGVPLIVVLMSGGALSSPWADVHADAVLWTGFNGEFAGTGLFDVLSGRVNPGGRLPYTIPSSVLQLPDISEYNYRPNSRNLGRTYRWIDLSTQAPLYPFGYGLSYTTWHYSDLAVVGPTGSSTVRPCDNVTVTVTVHNTGVVAGSEVVQVYITNTQASHPPAPRWALTGFERVDVQPGAKQTMTFSLAPSARSEVAPSDATRWVGTDTAFVVWVGGGQPQQGSARSTSNILSSGFKVAGAGPPVPVRECE